MSHRAKNTASRLACVAIVLGAGRLHAQTATPSRPAPPLEERRSTGKMVTGIILTSCGIVNATAGGALSISSVTYCEGEFCGVGLVTGIAGIAMGGVLMGVGIPLWVSGAGDPEASDGATRAIPALDVSPRAASVRWTF